MSDRVPEDDFEGLTAMAASNLDDGRLEDAEASLIGALTLKPGSAETLCRLGRVQHRQGRSDAAMESFRQALSFDPGLLAAERGRGGVLMDRGEFQAALECAERVLTEHPNDAEAHVLRAQLLLLHGQLSEGWPEYEWRWKTAAGLTDRRDFEAPLWKGRSPRGIDLLVWGEADIGHDVMFAGILPGLVAAGARLTLECDRRLVELMRRSFPEVTCVERTTPPSPEIVPADFDAHIPIGNLGRWMRPEPAAFGKPAPYLTVDRGLWERLRVGGADKPLVGICWRGTAAETRHRDSPGLDEWRLLVEVPGVTFVALQGDASGEERAQFEARTGAALLYDEAASEADDWDGHGARIAAMDLVITASSDTAHLAGALGVPCWVLLSATPSWWWFLGRGDSPWYSSVRLFRQPAPDRWSHAVAAAKEALSIRYREAAP